MLNKSGKSEHPYLVPDFRGETFSFSPWSMILAVHARSVVQSCPTLCSPMDCSRPGFPVHHQLPELVQTHVHQVSDAIQPSAY